MTEPCRQVDPGKTADYAQKLIARSCGRWSPHTAPLFSIALSLPWWNTLRGLIDDTAGSGGATGSSPRSTRSTGSIPRGGPAGCPPPEAHLKAAAAAPCGRRDRTALRCAACQQAGTEWFERMRAVLPFRPASSLLYTESR